MDLVHTEVEKETGIVFQLWVEVEDDVPVRGNALASGDAKADKRCEDAIMKRLNRGDYWAWCRVKCTAILDDIEGSDYLGCCSYRNTKEFIQPGGYWDDLKAEAKRIMLELTTREKSKAKR